MSEQLKQLAHQIQECMSADRYACQRQWNRLHNDSRKGRYSAEKTAKLAQRIDESVARRRQRQASVPPITFPELPVTGKKDEIAATLAAHQVVIVCGETGSGKTTQLPKICLRVGRGQAGFIGHTQPRRMAARTVADRIAEELGEPLGKTVGYKVRFHDKTHPQSLIKLMTDGILLAEIQNDPYLNQYDTLIIDEAHERSLNIDFLLGYMKWLLPRRQDLKLVITSATIDPERFAKHFSSAPIIEVSGRTYPVEIRYRPIEMIEEDDETSADLQQGIVAAVDELERDLRGDILIFLNGEQEIRETAESLKKHAGNRYEILPLYAKLSVSEQERVFKPKGNLRIVLATNVAETSLTVPGIRCVIDSGHARISRYSHRSKIQRLPIEKISQASAKQRAGRCGRVAEGICIRLYSEEDYLARPEFTEPEILRTNLSSVILQMTALNLGDIEDFPFVEPPEQKMIRDGKTMLHEVNALDKQGKMTEVGRQLAKIPTDPKLARMLLAADRYQCLSEVAIIVAALSIQDPREKPADKMQQADSKHATFKAEDSDFLTLLNLWNTFQEQKQHLSNNKLRQYCREHFLSYLRMREWHDIHTQIMQVVKGELKLKPNMAPSGYAEIHRALLPGLLSNIGFRHEQYEYLGARNLKFYIFPGSGQHKARPKWIMAAEHVETSKVYARTVAKIEPEWVEACAQHLIKRHYYDPHWEKNAGRCGVYERTLLYGLTLQAKRKIPYERVDAKAAREMFIRDGLVAQDYVTSAAFYKANQRLLEEVGYIQHKGRRVDLVEDEEWLYRFYDDRIPPDVVNGITLDQWRKQAEKANPRVLYITKEDLTRNDEQAIDERNFPDSLRIGDLTIALQYRFEPGHGEDGVTAVIPVHQLNQLTPQVFEWLVPGMLEEKLVALIKTLPKHLRRHFVPVPQTAKECLEIDPEPRGSLYEWLGRRLLRLKEEPVPLNVWQPESLPDHLKMNFRIVDESGQTVGYGRDLSNLQRRHSAAAGTSFDQLAAEEIQMSGCIGWVFDDLPPTWQFRQKGQTFVGYPAIVDEVDAVGVRLLDTREKADQLHQQGLNRLFQLHCRKDCTYLKKNLPLHPATAVQLSRCKPHPLFPEREHGDLLDDIVSRVIAEVFIRQRDIRTRAEFESSEANHRKELLLFANNLVAVVNQIAELLIKITERLAQPAVPEILQADVAEQLSYLVYAGFVRYTPFAWLQYMPRYLKAVLHRLDKCREDQQKQNELQRYWQRYWRRVQDLAKTDTVMPEQQTFRWSLEEFRVSLFAQQLKTAVPVSAKRLEKAWNEQF